MNSVEHGLAHFQFSFERLGKRGAPGKMDQWLERLFTQWAEVCEKIYLAGKPHIIAFSQNELASVSLVSGAANRLGMLAISELPVPKKRQSDRRRKPAYGRADLLIFDEMIGDWVCFEAKQTMIGANPRSDNVAAWIAAANDDAGRHIDGESCYSLTFFSTKMPTRGADDCEANARAAFDQLVSVVRQEKPLYMVTLCAKNFEHTICNESVMEDGSRYYYPGVVVAIS